jgi:uncharacterized protein YhaN
MRIVDLEIDGFGVWHGLSVDEMSERLNVVYGANEAGKTTLLDFIRSILYGFAPQRRARYLPPLRGGRPGGSLALAGGTQQVRITRYLDDDAADEVHGIVRVADHQGHPLSESHLKHALSGVDEATFNNVFAVGLRDMQELATLNATTAGQFLYSLTTGLDRVSLFEVTRELETSRRRLLAADERPSQIPHLLSQREKLQAELQELGEITSRYADLSAQRNQLNDEVEQLQAQIAHCKQEIVLLELSSLLREKWDKRAGVEREITALGTIPKIPEGTLERLEQTAKRLQKARSLFGEVKTRVEHVRLEIDTQPYDEALARRVPRVEAVLEQQEWVANLERQLHDQTAEITRLESELNASRQRLGEHGDVGALTPREIRRATDSVRSAARNVRRQRTRLREAKESAKRNEQDVRKFERTVGDKLAVDLGENLTETLQAKGELVAQLRRRVQLDDKFSQLTRQRGELESEQQLLLEAQVPPIWSMFGLGALFIGGIVLFLAGLILPMSLTGAMGWPFMLLGMVGTAVAVSTKHLVDRTSKQQLDTCRRQLRTITHDLNTLKEQRDELDRNLPRGGGPLTSRLQAAEKELAALEEVVPLAARQNAVAGRAANTSHELEAIKADYQAALSRWHEGLASAGLPDDLQPRQVVAILASSRQTSRLSQRLEILRQERSQTELQLASLRQRVDELSPPRDAAVMATAVSTRLRELRNQLAHHAEGAERRESLLKQLRSAHKDLLAARRRVNRFRRMRLALLTAAGATDEAELRQRAERLEALAKLEQKRDEISADMASHLEGHEQRSRLESMLTDNTAAEVDQLWEQAGRDLQQAEGQVHVVIEQRGAVSEQLKILAGDRRLGLKQLELSSIEQRLREAVEQWQVLAITSTVLESVRRRYESDRQPATLQYASVYLEQMTDGRYGRIWTPLAEDVLRVNDSEGRSLPVEVLSEGTREQVFLSLRMALARWYAERGVRLPLVLDDVLVNFDVKRALAAAKVMKEFSEQGHQILLLTCHEHIAQMFLGLEVPVQQLSLDGMTRLVRQKPVEVAELPPPALPPIEAELHEIVQEIEMPVLPPKRAAKPAPKPAPAPTPPIPAPIPVAVTVPSDEDIPWDVPVEAGWNSQLPRRRRPAPVARSLPREPVRVERRYEPPREVFYDEPNDARAIGRLLNDGSAEEFDGEFNERLVDNRYFRDRDAEAA